MRNCQVIVWLVLLVALGGNIVLAATPPGQPVMPAVRNFAPRYSPDGKWITFLRGSDPQTDSELWVMEATGKNARLVVTRDAMREMLACGDMLTMHPVVMPNVRELKTRIQPEAISSPYISSYTWLPTSETLVCQLSDSQSGKGGLYEVTLDSSYRQLSHPLGDHYHLPPAEWSNFILSPDGKEFVFISKDVFFRSYLTINKPILNKPGFHCDEASWCSDGNIYAAEAPIDQHGGPSSIRRITQDGGGTPIISSTDYRLRLPSLSPDGKWLAYLRWYGAILHGKAIGQLNIRELATGNDIEAAQSVMNYRWLADGRLLAVTYNIHTLSRRNDPGAPQEAVESIVITRPGYQKADLLFQYRTTMIPSLMADTRDFYRPTGKMNVYFADNKPHISKQDNLPFDTAVLPDISPDGKRMVYQCEGALYLLDLPVAGQDYPTNVWPPEILIIEKPQ